MAELFPLSLIHAAVGDLALFAFVWAFVELIDPNPTRVKRAMWASTIGFLAVWVAIVAGVLYHSVPYQELVKPVIKSGPFPWGHKLLMEPKETLVYFGGPVATLAMVLVWSWGDKIIEDKAAWKVTLIVLGTVVLGGLAMAMLGAGNTAAFRAAIGK